VSLLMDALRKAEQQKQQIAAQESPEAGFVPNNLELEPLSAKAEAGQLPELPKRLEDLDDQFFTNEAPSAKSIRVPASTQRREPGVSSSPQKEVDTTSRDAVRNVFAAKQAAVKENYSFAIVAGLSTLVAAAAIGGYLYWQMQPKGGVSAGSLLTPATPAAAPPAPADLAKALPAQPAQQSVPTAAKPFLTAAPVEPTSVAKPGKLAHAERAEPLAGSITASPDRQTAATARPLAQDVPIRVSSATRKLDPNLEKAHQAFNRGEFASARAAWLGVLQSDPRNPDALHGLAAIAQQEGQAEQAADYYLRALEVDPKDALAVSGLASLKGSTDTRQTESRLKALLAELPDSPYLNFALGNLYAQGARWAEAQQAYFKAHAADPENPDYLYNLAVSLDHLHQPRLAAQYYGRALEAGRRQVAGFDAVQAAVRLKTLQSSLPH
jgi:Tfp pilus assembly protein PilF